MATYVRPVSQMERLARATGRPIHVGDAPGKAVTSYAPARCTGKLLMSITRWARRQGHLMGGLGMTLHVGPLVSASRAPSLASTGPFCWNDRPRRSHARPQGHALNSQIAHRRTPYPCISLHILAPMPLAHSARAQGLSGLRFGRGVLLSLCLFGRQAPGQALGDQFSKIYRDFIVPGPA